MYVYVRLLHKCMRLCVGCAVFAYIYVRLLHVKLLVRTYTDFARSPFCVYGYGFLILLTSRWSDLEGLLIRSTSLWYNIEVPLFVWRSCECLWLLERLEGPSGGSNIQGSLSDDLHVLIGPSGGSSLLGSVEIFICRCSRDSLSDSYLGLSLVDIVEQYITRCSNITKWLANHFIFPKYEQRTTKLYHNWEGTPLHGCISQGVP